MHSRDTKTEKKTFWPYRRFKDIHFLFKDIHYFIYYHQILNKVLRFF